MYSFFRPANLPTDWRELHTISGVPISPRNRVDWGQTEYAEEVWDRVLASFIEAQTDQFYHTRTNPRQRERLTSGWYSLSPLLHAVLARHVANVFELPCATTQDLYVLARVKVDTFPWPGGLRALKALGADFGLDGWVFEILHTDEGNYVLGRMPEGLACFSVMDMCLGVGGGKYEHYTPAPPPAWTWSETGELLDELGRPVPSMELPL